jgi:hypothetical protein
MYQQPPVVVGIDSVLLAAETEINAIVCFVNILKQ